MFSEIFLFEIRRAFRKPAIYIYWAILFAMGFFIMNVAGGAFESINMSIGGDNLKVNSPGILNIIFGMFGYLGIFIVAAVVSNVVIKDFRYNTLSLVFTTRIKKMHYITGRFSAAFFLNVVVFTGAGIGVYLGTIMPYLNPEYFGEFMWKAYLNPYGVRVIPNIFFITAIFFTLSLLLRNVVVNWLSILGFYILYAIGQNLLGDLDKRNLAALLDPFGIIASLTVTTGSTASDMNQDVVSLERFYLYNRIIWVAIGILSLVLAYVKFQFSFALKPVKLFRKKKEVEPIAEGNTKKRDFNLPKSKRSFNVASWWKVFKHQTAFELKSLSGNPYFILISLIAVIFLFVASNAIGKIYDTETYPVTYQVIDILNGSLTMFLYVLIILFSGEMLSRDKGFKLDEISGALPVKRWIFLGSKMLTLALAVAFLLLVMIACGILFQAKAGYFQFEIGQYFTSVFGLQYVKYLLLIAMAFFVHVLVNNKYIGYVVMIVFMVWQNYFAGTILQHNLLIYAGGPDWAYSDMNGYGFSAFPYWAFKIYWLLFAAMLTVGTNLLLVVQSENTFKARFRLLKSRLNKPVQLSLVSVLVLFLAWGGYLFYNTNVENDFKRSYTMEKQQVDYEQKYKKYAGIAQPKITDVKLAVDMYPETGVLEIAGKYWLKNLSGKRMDSIHIMKSRLIKEFGFKAVNSLVYEDAGLDYYIYKLQNSLMPGDSVQMEFNLVSEAKGFGNRGKENIVLKNGTFFHNTLFPTIGYDEGMELFSKKIRAKHELAEKPVSRNVDDVYGISRNFITDDSDFISFEVVISTSGDQTALAPGNLIEEWQKDGRNYFHYRMPQKMINYYALLSARYEVAEEKWQFADGREVNVAIYHHSTHDYNLKSMFRGVKESLSYYSDAYSDFQYDQLRIVEFPRHSSYAQSFPNMIPFSEGLGFIADLRDLENENTDFEDLKIDYPFFVTAHEMAHQWWAHQVIAADVEGAQMLMESVTQYSAFKVMENYYGKANMKKFLRDETFRYLSSRKNESHVERPLTKVAQYQSHIYYNKGGQALYALDDYLGENTLTEVLQKLNQQFAFKGAPYATTNDFMTLLQPEIPDSLQYLVNDLMDNIVFYDNDVREANYTRNEDLEYFVEATIEGEKFYADGLGEEKAADMNDWVEIGIYNTDNQEIMLKKVKLQSGENKYRFKLHRKPSKIILDPYYKVIDKEFSRRAFDIVKLKKED